MRTILVMCAVLLFAGGQAFGQAVVDVPMDQQINLGLPGTDQSPNGDAIYIPSFGNGTLTFGTDGADGWSRQNILLPSWWYLYVDLNLAGIGEMDLSGTGSTIEFDTRFYQDPATNDNPYGDAPVFVRIYTYDTDGITYLGHRNYGIVYATQNGDPPYPTWTHVTIDVGTGGTDGGVFDPARVSRVRFYGTDWGGAMRDPAGDSDDFVDVKDLKITAVPEPASALALLAGIGGLIPFIRRRR